MKRFAIAAVTAIALLALLVAALPFIVPGSVLRDVVAGRLSNWTGRTVVVDGLPRFSLYPDLVVTIDNVTFKNPPEMGDEAFATVDAIRAQILPLPLLIGRIEFAEFELVRPRFRFVVLKDGSSNWDMSSGSIARMSQRAVTRAAEAAAVAAADPDSPAPIDTTGQAVRMGRITIIDGTILYDDLTADRREEATNLAFDMSWPYAAGPAVITGSLAWRGEPVLFNGLIRQPLKLMGGATSSVRFGLAATTLRASFAGDAQISAAPYLVGDASVATPSLRRTMTWLGHPMESDATLGVASVSGTLVWDGETAAFEPATVLLDGNQATGSLSFARGPERPIVRGTLSAERLDLSAYADAARAEINANGPWPIAPVRLPYAEALDAELAISTKQLVAGPARLGKAAGTLSLQDGRVTVGVDEAQFYGGAMSGQASLLMAGDDLTMSLEGRVARVPARAALTDIAGIDGLDGSATASLAVTARGKTWGEFLRSLSGGATVEVAGGSLAQDLVGIADSLADPLADALTPEGGKTTFASLTATLAISGGILATDDLTLKGGPAVVTLRGDGSVVTGLVAAQGTLRALGHEVPIVVGGGWRAPRVARDAAPPAPAASAGIQGSGG